MDARKINILNAIIEAYIDMPTPVGSRTLSKEYHLGVSSATIRNEMADLEDLGFLNKPHQSAGRIPSDKAYRFYVDEIFKSFSEFHDIDASKKIKDRILYTSRNLEDFYKNSVNLLANISNCTAYLITPQKADTKIKRLTLVKIDRNTALLVLIGDKGVIERYFLEIENISDEDFYYIEKVLNEKMSGIDFDKIESLKISLSDNMIRYGNFISNVVKIASEFNKKVSSIEIYYDGLTNILNFDEYRDLDKAKDFMSLVEDRDSLFQILKDDNFTGDVEVIIGSENSASLMKENTIIRAPFTKDYGIYGSIGIIGPVRIDYMRLVKVVKIFSDALTRGLKEM
ncbi:heat-inducible transcription repressor HrcA [Peptoniphilus sp. AGMB00490]|uniref:Heat-inducible transcription repressor HrcA n=2 Tax=Peptoniphilus TaxID=162289 RepID=A0ACD6AYU2_9FIRM|nr:MULTISPECIES: heat-inducible transcriptional repressor HrcA [Peptoniphilus]NMW84313.1 heat-inducible transcription repressor HrcA [Peptoniphilus faecalis]OLR64345.1 heat-inducible transcription repressor HrcA [Peptoniphilus porci]